MISWGSFKVLEARGFCAPTGYVSNSMQSKPNDAWVWPSSWVTAVGCSKVPLRAGCLCGLPQVWMTLSSGPWVSSADVPTLSATVWKLWSSSIPPPREQMPTHSSLDTFSWTVLVHSSVDSYGQLTSFFNNYKKEILWEFDRTLEMFQELPVTPQ